MNYIYEILRNEKYKGVYLFIRKCAKDISGMHNNYKDKREEDIIRVEGGMPRIIDDKTFASVAAISSGRKKGAVQSRQDLLR